MPPESASRRPGRDQRRFRRWRRGRPFWGGLLLVLAGVELWVSDTFSFEIEISFGPQGFLSLLLPVLLLLSGLLSWLTPQYRHFYGIVGLLTAVYSLLGLNFGGLFIGMLLGIVGGSLVVAWTPVTPAAPDGAQPEDGQPDAGAAGGTHTAGDAPTAAQPPVPQQTTGPLTDETPGADQIAPVRSPRKPPRTFVVAALPLVLAGAVTAPMVTAAQDTGSCTESVTVAQTSSPTPSPSSSPPPGPTTSPEPCEPEPTPTGEPSATAPPPSTAPAPDPTEPPPGDATPEPSLTPPPEVPVPPGHPLVSTDPSLMTADVLDLRGFVFEGIAELPTADGTITTLVFTFDRATASDMVLVSNRAREPQTTAADELVLSGDVVFYASRFSGRALGIVPITLDPESPGFLEALLELVDLPLAVSFTDVEQELVYTTGGQLQASGFDQTGASA